MKKILSLVLALAIVLAGTGTVFAGKARNNTGCGLGTVLWGDKADESVLSQTLQVTTNGTFGNQTFGITSGTLDCERPVNFATNDKLLQFASDNMDVLAKDIAMGQGESLETLAELMEVPVLDRPVFYGALQNNFDSIFVTGQETSAQMLDRIVAVVN